MIDTRILEDAVKWAMEYERCRALGFTTEAAVAKEQTRLRLANVLHGMDSLSGYVLLPPPKEAT